MTPINLEEFSEVGKGATIVSIVLPTYLNYKAECRGLKDELRALFGDMCVEHGDHLQKSPLGDMWVEDADTRRLDRFSQRMQEPLP